MPKIPVDLIIHSASELVTVCKRCDGPKRRGGMDWLGILENGALAIEIDEGGCGIIVAVAPTDHILKYYECPPEKMISAAGKIVLPGLVDPHTHLVFAGSRHEEYVEKIRGKSYVEIHQNQSPKIPPRLPKLRLGAGGQYFLPFTKGGNTAGILYTVEITRRASKEELIKKALKDLDIMMSHGTTTIEAKSGYGLDRENEIKILEVIQELSRIHPMTIIPTFLGAHTVPTEYKNDRREYVRLVISMLSEIKERRLADFCDVFCDPLGFSLAETTAILYAAKESGMKLKAHAEQTKPFGGSALAAALGAVSADHLDFADSLQINEMAKAGVIGVLLPGVTHHLMEARKLEKTKKQDFPTLVKEMIEAGLPIALATDYNPGSSPTQSMQAIMELAARLYRMTPAQIINAATINAAYAIGRGKEVGSLEQGKWADIVIFDCPAHEMLIDGFGVNKVWAVIKKGIKVC